jgi:uroporphyrinogen-III synthase
MQLNKIRILSTRPLSQPIIKKAAKSGVQIDTKSFIKTEAIKSPDTIQQIISLAGKKITAVFTSMNAVEAVTANLSSKPDWKIFCMGGATKELVFNFFGEAAVIASARDSSSLSEKIIAAENLSPVVFFCGDQRLDQLPETLKGNKIDITEVQVYTTVQTPHLVEKNYDGIVFFSPSAVHSFFDINTIATDVILFAIGKTTATAINTYVQNELVVSKWPGKEQMIEQVVDYFESANQESKNN